MSKPKRKGITKQSNSRQANASLSDTDKKRIITTLRLWKPGTLRFPTSDDLEKLMGWYIAPLDGVAFGKQWSDYTVYYIGVSWWPSHPVGFNTLDLNACGIPTPEKPDKPVLLCGVRIHYKQSRAYAEILFRGTSEDYKAAESIQNTQFCKNEKDILDAWRGFELFKYFAKQRGRKPRKYTDRLTFEKDALGAHISLVRWNQENYYEHVYEYSQEAIAAEMGFRSVRGWCKRADKLGVDRDRLKKKAIRCGARKTIEAR